MDEIKQFIGNHWVLVPLGIFVVATLAIACRKDRGALIFKKRTDVLLEEKKVYYLFQVLKYVVILMVIANLFIKLTRGDY